MPITGNYVSYSIASTYVINISVIVFVYDVLLHVYATIFTELYDVRYVALKRKLTSLALPDRFSFM